MRQHRLSATSIGRGRGRAGVIEWRLGSRRRRFGRARGAERSARRCVADLACGRLAPPYRGTRLGGGQAHARGHPVTGGGAAVVACRNVARVPGLASGAGHSLRQHRRSLRRGHGDAMQRVRPMGRTIRARHADRGRGERSDCEERDDAAHLHDWRMRGRIDPGRRHSRGRAVRLSPTCQRSMS